MKCLTLIALATLAIAAHAAIEPGTGRKLRASEPPKTVIERATKRAEMRRAGPQVVSQRIEHGEVISLMTDGSEIRAPLKRATTARAPDAIARLRIERAVARILAALGDSAKPAKQADAIEKLADKIEKEKNK
jgi:hypothetical protein